MKKNTNLLVLLCLMLTLPFSIKGQLKSVEFKKENFIGKDKEFKQSLISLRKGKKYYNYNKRGIDNKAIEYFLEAYNFNPNNAELNFVLGACYLKSDFKTKALPYLIKSFDLKPNVSPDIKYMLGQAYHYNLNYDYAIAYYNDYLKDLSQSDLIKKETEVNKRIQECNQGKVLIRNPVKINLENLGNNINTSFNEYGPLINESGTVLFYTSRRDNTTGGKKDPNDNIFFEDIYVSEMTNNVWEKSFQLLPPFNTKKSDAVAGISHDGRNIIIFRGKVGGGDLYECSLNGTSWTSPKRLPKAINSTYRETSASYDTSKNILYFISDRIGGYGGSDIYKCEKLANGEWGRVTNLGPTINTPYDEISVFLASDNKTLYFSSRGHNTMGGADIFKSVIENGKWTSPENLGYPLNGPDDDVHYSVTKNQSIAYYSSVKKDGMGGYDIYKLEISTEKEIKIVQPEFLVIKGAVYDDNNIPVKAKIEIADNISNEKYYIFSDSLNGLYTISVPRNSDFSFSIIAQGYNNYNESIKIVDEKEIQRNIKLDKIPKPFVINNIYFDFNKYDLLDKSKEELAKINNILQQNIDIFMEINGHCDTIGTYAYNLTLSIKRAKNAYNQLLKNNFNKNRMSFKGFSFMQPIAPNRKSDGTDNPEGRAKNRRVEFKYFIKKYIENLDNIK